MLDLTLWLQALGALLGVAIIGWLISLPLRNVSLVDTLWSLKFLLCAGLYVGLQQAHSPRALLLLILVAIWAVRLSVYITVRNHGHGEDRQIGRAHV